MIAGCRAQRSRRLRGGLAAAVLAGVVMTWGGHHPPAAAQMQMTVRLTAYLPTGNVMYSGHYPFWGAAACSWNFPEGTVLALPDGLTVTCLDRGLLGADGWVDVFAPDWPTARWLHEHYGPWTDVAVLRWGYG